MQDNYKNSLDAISRVIAGDGVYLFSATDTYANGQADQLTRLGLTSILDLLRIAGYSLEAAKRLIYEAMNDLCLEWRGLKEEQLFKHKKIPYQARMKKDE